MLMCAMLSSRSCGGQRGGFTALMLERDHQSVPECALNTWLTGVDCEFGPDCEDISHFWRPSIDCFETVQLLEESGFGFLPEAARQNQPSMETVMSVGLRLCALEFTSKQLKVLAYLSVSELLPDSFPHGRWVLAVQRSFCTQKAAVCTSSAEWEEVRILELVQTPMSQWNRQVAQLSGLGIVSVCRCRKMMNSL